MSVKRNHGQLTVTALVVSFIILLFLVVLAVPLWKAFIGNTMASGAFDGTLDGWVMILFPTIAVIAGIVGFFVWNSTVT